MLQLSRAKPGNPASNIYFAYVFRYNVYFRLDKSHDILSNPLCSVNRNSVLRGFDFLLASYYRSTIHSVPNDHRVHIYKRNTVQTRGEQPW